MCNRRSSWRISEEGAQCVPFLLIEPVLTSGARQRVTGAWLRIATAYLRCLATVVALTLWLVALPALAADGDKPKSIKLFGTVEFRGPLKGVPAWLDVLERNKKSPLLVAGAKLNSSTMWDDFKDKLKAMPPMEQLKAVNRFWNQWPYRLDPEVYGKPDYWASPDEFRRKSGDCEDYSIAKYFMLKELGFSKDKMRVVVLMETVRNVAHAVLVVYLDDDAWILDNLSNNVLSHSRYKSYVPQFSVNENNRWAHVRPK